MTDADASAEIIACEIRLHAAHPHGDLSVEAVWADWSATAVGRPVNFEAIADTGRRAWNGPLSPGVRISPPVPLDDPYWTVFLPSARGRPVLAGRVGRALGVGEAFTLAAGTPGQWQEGVPFDGAIVVD